MLAKIEKISENIISLNNGRKTINVRSNKFQGFAEGDIVSLYGKFVQTPQGAWVYRVSFANKASEKQIEAYTANSDAASAPEPAKDIKAAALELKLAGVKADEAAKQLGISRSTFYKYVKAAQAVCA